MSTTTVSEASLRFASPTVRATATPSSRNLLQAAWTAASLGGIFPLLRPAAITRLMASRFSAWYASLRLVNSASAALASSCAFASVLSVSGLRCSGVTFVIVKVVTMPSVPGSNAVAANPASVVLSRSRDAVKNCWRRGCSGVDEQPTSVAAASVSASDRVIPHLLGNGTLRVGWFGWSLRRGVLVFFFDEARDRDDLIVAFDVDQGDALRRAADRPDVVGLHSQDHPLLGDDQQFIAFLHIGDADDQAVAGRRGDVDDTDAAARLHAIFVDLGPLAEAPFGHRQERTAGLHDLHRNDVVVVAQVDAADAVRGPAHRPDVGFGEPDRHAVAGRDEHLTAAVGDLHRDHRIVRFHAHGNDAAGARVGKGRQFGFLHHAFARAHDDELVLFELLPREHGGDPLPLLHRDEVGDRLALAARPDVGDLVDLQPVGAAAVGEDHDVGVRRGDEQVADEILFARAHADAPLAAALLVAIRGDRRPLDVAGVADGDRHVLFVDQLLDAEVAGLAFEDLGAAIVAVLVADPLQLVDDDLHQQPLAGENRAQTLDG